jgi:predicted component of type VI protein secretion system
MATAKRKSDPAINQQLFDRFYEFSFYRAVYLLDRFSGKRKKLGDALVPSEESVRFRTKKGFSFPPSDISALKAAVTEEFPSMEVAFLGLTGPSGVLPQWYSQLILERDRNKDHALADFLDLFNHRLITLFYLAWKKHRFPENYQPGGRDRLSRLPAESLRFRHTGVDRNDRFAEESIDLLQRAALSAYRLRHCYRGCRGLFCQCTGAGRAVYRTDRRCGAIGSDAAGFCQCHPWVMTPFAAVRCGKCQTKFRIHLGAWAKRTSLSG